MEREDFPVEEGTKSLLCFGNGFNCCIPFTLVTAGVTITKAVVVITNGNPPLLCPPWSPLLTPHAGVWFG